MSFADPDWIAFRGLNRMLFGHPLEAFLRNLTDQPEFQRRGTAAGRGYVAQWEVRNDQTLWLTGLTTAPPDRRLDPGSWLGSAVPGPVSAAWVSQCLRVPDTGQRRFSTVGNGSTYARESYLSVWRGRLVMIEETDGRTGRRVGGELTAHLEGVFDPDEAAFLRSAFADSDDAAPRLVYADWLDERHDPRATVVRLAERLRHADPELAGRERSAGRDVIRRGQDHWLWMRLLGYHHLATELVAVMA